MLTKMKKGSFTVEASVLIPLILFLVGTAITSLFYFHDKNVLAGAAHETAIVGSGRAGYEEEELETYFAELIKRKLFWFVDANVSIKKTKKYVKINVTAERYGTKVSFENVVAITEPEKWIRNIRRFENGSNLQNGFE